MPGSIVARTLRPATTALAIAQPVATQAYRLGNRGKPETDEASALAGPVTPAAGAFVIWLPLFLASIVFGRGLEDRRRQDHPELSKVESLAATAFAADAAWSLTSQFRGLGWPSLGLIATAASSATLAMLTATRHADGSKGMTFAARWIGGLAGWLSVATFANVEATLNRQFGRPSPAEETRRATALIAGAGAATTLVALSSRGSRTYAAAAGWGLGGIALKARREGNRPVMAAALGAGAALLAATIAAGTIRRRAD